jgi:DNA-binding transcriptional regulator YiaG
VSGADIKAWRDAIGLSAAEFGRRLGVSQQAVAAWETEENPVPPMVEKFKRQIDENGALKQIIRKLTGKPVGQVQVKEQRKK